mmetsp:Transcript_36542/g.103201  ORF Transcript_36542/g.103201 Transcript_36542/m.103201 type:complete len:168 (-) Transcript_36542:457-960(-)|eukprot:CAMPEP_0117687542 /NCGR_PEP_ID=MMETSP0804-20121206/23204_1 /TAXON_ID=1074897 /ORGANISM="Tetraselmis astigmatica, Strain CCMP880" /LENGTH=167 /DNA_ID=CAMNT_0005499639 /DNA_START=150 /DNA_END=653 /DNA_ORIENTATION=+
MARTQIALLVLAVLAAAPVADGARNLLDDGILQKPEMGPMDIALPGSAMTSSQKAKMLHRTAPVASGTGVLKRATDTAETAWAGSIRAAPNAESVPAVEEALPRPDPATENEEEVPEYRPKGAKVFRFKDPQQMKEYIHRTKGMSHKDGNSRVILPVHWARVPKKNP